MSKAVFLTQENGMVVASQLDILMPFAGTVRTVNKCPQPKEQKKIAANKQKLSEQKQNARETIGGNKPSSNNDSGTYN